MQQRVYESTAAIVVNTRSGNGTLEVHDLSRRLAERLAQSGVSARSIAFGAGKRPRQVWRELLHRSLEQGVDRVYVLGGDGTVLAVAEALLGQNVALGIIPMGTANLLARDLGIPLEPAAAIEALADPRVLKIDAGRVNGQLFLCASMMGLTTDLARTREAARGAGMWRMLPKMIQKGYWLLRRYPFRQMRLVLDDTNVSVSTRAIFVANNPIKPEPSLYPRRERLDGGRLGVYCVEEGPLYELPLLVLSLLNGTWDKDPRIFAAASARLTITTPQPVRFTVLTDGEPRRLITPLHYELLPQAISVLAPQAAS